MNYSLLTTGITDYVGINRNQKSRFVSSDKYIKVYDKLQ